MLTSVLDFYAPYQWLVPVVIGVTTAGALHVSRRARSRGTSPWVPLVVIVSLGLVSLVVLPFAILLWQCHITGDCV